MALPEASVVPARKGRMVDPSKTMPSVKLPSPKCAGATETKDYTGPLMGPSLIENGAAAPILGLPGSFIFMSLRRGSSAE